MNKEFVGKDGRIAVWHEATFTGDAIAQYGLRRWLYEQPSLPRRG